MQLDVQLVRMLNEDFWEPVREKKANPSQCSFSSFVEFFYRG